MQAGASLTLSNAWEHTIFNLYSNESLDLLSNLRIKSAAIHQLFYELTWLCRHVVQFPTDIVAIQELLWKLQPDVVVEAGVGYGGSQVFSASILELIGKVKLTCEDIEIRPYNSISMDAHPLKHRTELIEAPLSLLRRLWPFERRLAV